MGLMTRSIPLLLLIAVAGVAVMGLLALRMSVRVRTNACSQAIRYVGDMPADALARMCQKTFFFGHRSVGSNIIEGMRDLMRSHSAFELHIEETKDADRIASAMLAHAPMGRNGEPESKIAEFREVLENGLGGKVDVAFLKFCYVDVRSESDPQALLDVYCDTIEALKTRFPKVLFLHVTVPLRAAPQTVKSTLKATVKRIVGASTVLDDNRVRARYNELLRERFSGKEPLFDLAGHEAISPDGLQWFVLWKGHEIPVLGPSYTDDGGHLNAAGRRHVAEQLLVELLKLSGASQ